MRALWILLVLPMAASAELVSFGVKGGVPLTNAFKIGNPSAYIADKQPYTIGPVFEVHLPFRVSIEADALYKPVKYRASFENGSQSRTTGRSWELPVLLKYRFSSGVLRPYLGAGLAFRSFGGIKQVVTNPPNPVTGETGQPPELQSSSGMGAVLGGGLQVKLLFLKIAPEVRYTRWNSAAFLDVIHGFHSHANQAELLIGLTF